MNRRPFLATPLKAVIVIVSLYTLLTAMAMLSLRTWNWAEVRNEEWPVRCALLAVGSGLIGIYRVLRYHPHQSPRYAKWLMTTPWRPGDDLPLGSVSLVWEDLLFMIPLGLLAHFDAGLWFIVPTLFYIMGHCVGALETARTRKGGWLAIAFAFTISLALLFARSEFALFIISAAIFVIARAALVESLKGFPWDLGDSMIAFKRRPKQALSWPLTQLAPLNPDAPIQWSTSLAISVLLGWWVFVGMLVSHASRAELLDFVGVPVQVFCCLLTVIRLGRYVSGYFPPISIRGRLWTGNLIIPGYDQIFIAPALMMIFGLGLPRVLPPLLPLPIVGGLTVTIVIAIMLMCGPTIRSWQLTGKHSMKSMGGRQIDVRTSAPRSS